MQIFLVGGSVRDELLGLPVSDRDWVVIGSTPNEMLRLGFRQVGKDFPVFLHPHTNEQYALARIERKIGPGYYGFECIFSPDTTLVEDLQRRDLTINALAKAENGEIIDPFDGQLDLKNKILRHVSPAFVEDPLRVLRVARFLAKFYDLGFRVAPATMDLMHKMVASGDLDSLVKERVWSEMMRACETKSPEQFFLLIKTLKAWSIIAPELNAVDFEPLQRVARQSSDLKSRLGALACGFKDKQQFLNFAQNISIPHELKKFCTLCVSYQRAPLDAREIYSLFKALKLYHEGDLATLHQFLQACADLESYPRLLDAYQSTLRCNARDIQDKGFVGPEITRELDLARVKLIEIALASRK